MFEDDEYLTEEQRLARRRAAEKRPVDEAGGGVAEGFEEAEELLVDHASHSDQHSTQPIMRDARDELDRDPQDEHAQGDDVHPEDEA
ncbi:hypothetical protein [Paraconexibacter sp.]|uniref:hypothetical protein n=1 Tax=Paraconexibacter sp. TaxID=2949640 RepID=UPI003568209F